MALVGGLAGEDDEQVVLEAGQWIPVRVGRVHQVEPLAQRLRDLAAQPGPHPQTVAPGFDHGGEAGLVMLGACGGHVFDPVLAGGEANVRGRVGGGGEGVHRVSPSAVGRAQR